MYKNTHFFCSKIWIKIIEEPVYCYEFIRKKITFNYKLMNMRKLYLCFIYLKKYGFQEEIKISLSV